MGTGDRAGRGRAGRELGAAVVGGQRPQPGHVPKPGAHQQPTLPRRKARLVPLSFQGVRCRVRSRAPEP